MTQKECRNLAKKLAKLEKSIEKASTTEEKSKIENQMMKLSRSIGSLEDMSIIDEYVMELLSEEKT